MQRCLAVCRRGPIVKFCGGRYLQRAENAAFLKRVLARHELLNVEADYVFAARFAGVLAYADDADVAMTRAELLADLRRNLAGREHVKRTRRNMPGRLMIKTNRWKPTSSC